MATIDGHRVRGDLVTLTGAAASLGVARAMLDAYRKRDREIATRNPFPDPVFIVGGVAVFRKSDVVEWNARRRPRTP
jgi:predicted DNA-binding transcriptional regulator AlpA